MYSIILKILIPIASVIIVNCIFYLPLIYSLQNFKAKKQYSLLTKAMKARKNSFYYGCIILGSLGVFIGSSIFLQSTLIEDLDAQCQLLSGFALVALGYMSYYCSIIKILSNQLMDKQLPNDANLDNG